MPRYRHQLPQLAGRAFVTDGGLETDLIFHHGVDLPHFAAFTLAGDADGRETLRRYYRRYLELAAASGRGIVLEAPTWRASRDWGALLGYSVDTLREANREALALMVELRDRTAATTPDAVISGNLGPRGDGYRAERRMSAAEAADYHGEQIATFADTEADLISAFTLNYVEEAIGIARAARTAGMPVVISFTLETDGRLPSGQSLDDAIRETDAATDATPAYYMINCAHPSHFRQRLAEGGDWRERIRGLRANASRLSHAELDEASELDEGDPEELGTDYRELRRLLPGLAVVGGCCGTDYRHVAAIARAFDA
ncbi:MAG: homocysteine S-methyltransferase family protein [Rhodocyclaceae bacterium]|nr:homocysteine S-methyltransferase family protein [Rhodocyclaceae bacterium]